MKNSDTSEQSSEKNHQQEKDDGLYVYEYPYSDMLERFRSAHPNNRKESPRYITPEIHSIHPVDFLKSHQFLSPSVYELLLKVVTDDELWRIFRQKAAEAVCKEDREYFLTVQSFPLCFAYAVERSWVQYRYRPKWFPLMLVNYTFDDLALIAEKILDGNNMNQQVGEKEE